MPFQTLLFCQEQKIDWVISVDARQETGCTPNRFKCTSVTYTVVLVLHIVPIPMLMMIHVRKQRHQPLLGHQTSSSYGEVAAHSVLNSSSSEDQTGHPVTQRPVHYPMNSSRVTNNKLLIVLVYSIPEDRQGMSYHHPIQGKDSVSISADT